MELNQKNNITNNLKANITLFNSFENVYLFGSILCRENIPNDIDLLLIYSAYSKKILDDLNYIESTLSLVFNLPVDLTVLSIEEEKNTRFLQKINSSYLKLK
ncbi:MULTISPECIES: nucleotidyltransferase domain-containing protein [Listeria]|uniref:nucleotidyltransferase domain-containing protein n=1 Tax=Listeria TaxID=1637 RepID=UPI000E70FD3C|nr:nucleotidyltransferase domain-containing protein [Listeria monocytogenes]EAD1192280.1 nucleotidyltransferase domain-containing protein [Listeria monocytogenes]EAF2233755.1 nucleotidyltransferase domain-containing protein [Listeria monocytogenes]EAF6814096.1 nucleotidyltransferase domain-containing protein [Listeria monocytogenes]EAG3578292.1 nucleotidyltransferase domain-containing protein [Listeria monocytogenes]